MSEVITSENNIDSVRSMSQLLKSKKEDKSFMNLAAPQVPKITLNDSTLELDEDQDIYHESEGNNSTVPAQEVSEIIVYFLCCFVFSVTHSVPIGPTEGANWSLNVAS